MASLRSIILDGKIAPPWDGPGNPTVEDLKCRDTILVNAQASFNSIKQAIDRDEVRIGLDGFRKIPQARPPFRAMWIESLQTWGNGEPRRNGILVRRDPALADEFLRPSLERASVHVPAIQRRLREDRPADVVMGAVWYERGGMALPGGAFCYWLDARGSFQYSFELLPQGSSEGHEDMLLCQQLWCLQTMAQLNCHNVELRLAESGQGRIRPAKKHVPFSVWHEIVVKPSLLARRARTANPVEAEKHAVRLHKVRGHYADYRSGAGLFGKYKILIWVDEHESGEAELGTVVSSYRLEQ